MSQEYDDERLERGEVRYVWLTDYASIRVGGKSGKHPDPTGRPVYISDNPSTGWIEQLTMPKLVRAMSPEIIDKAFEGLATLFEWETKRLAGTPSTST